MYLPFSTPTSILLAGPTMSGKTSFVIRLLQHASEMFSQAPTKILFCYMAWQSAFDKLKNMSIVELHEGLPPRSVITELGFEKGHKVLVLDDMMKHIVNDVNVQDYVTVSSHHNNMSIILLSQNIFAQGLTARTISLNCHYIIVFNNKRDASQVSRLGSQMFPRRVPYFVDSYEKATSRKYGYLLIDLSPHTERKYQLRTCIFPDESPTIVYADVKDSKS
jgi:hypothetical protein